MKAAVLAYHEMGCAGLEMLLALGARVVVVFTHEDDPRENQWFRSVAGIARKAGIPVHTPDDINLAAGVGALRAIGPDILFSFYYRRMVSAEILAIPPLGCYNLHGSLLPRYRGRNPTNWAIVQGEAVTGVTLHEMVRRADAGRILAQRQVEIGADEDARTVFLKQVEAFRYLFPEVYPRLLDGTAPRLEQDESRATKFRGRRPEDGKIDWSAPAQAIHNLVRAVARPYPGAFTSFEGRTCFMWRTRRVEGPAGAPPALPGTVIGKTPGGILAAAGSGVLEILSAQMPPDADLEGPRLGIRFAPEAGARFGA